MPRTAVLALVRHSLLRNHIPPQAQTLYRHNTTCVTFPRPRLFSMSNSTQYSSSSSSPNDGAAAVDETAATSSSKTPQGLPAPGQGSPLISLDVSGDGSTVKLSNLGPLVVNSDGTVARIANWQEMTDVERETTMRMVGSRNKKRLDALKKIKEEQENGTSSQP